MTKPALAIAAQHEQTLAIVVPSTQRSGLFVAIQPRQGAIVDLDLLAQGVRWSTELGTLPNVGDQRAKGMFPGGSVVKLEMLGVVERGANRFGELIERRLGSTPAEHRKDRLVVFQGSQDFVVHPPVGIAQLRQHPLVTPVRANH
jgi:hypothetical protein